MADLFDRWHDPVFGELAWNIADPAWTGRVQFGSRTVGISLDAHRRVLTTAEQLAIIEAARRAFESLRVVEPELRHRAAVQIGEAVCEQDEDAGLPLQEFADSLQLLAISLHGGGELHYRSPEFFPGQKVTIYFDGMLAFGDAEVYD